MDTTNIFTYSMENLSQHGEINIILFFVLAFIFLLAHFIARYIFLYIAGLSILLTEKRKIANKKKVLWDLILMKDIQTELEKEIEQATLKAAFQN